MSGSDSGSLVRRRRLEAVLDLRIWWPHPPPVRWVGRWVGRWRARGDRRFLAGLSDHALRDIGLDRVDVDADSTQSFWRRR